MKSASEVLCIGPDTLIYYTAPRFSGTMGFCILVLFVVGVTENLAYSINVIILYKIYSIIIFIWALVLPFLEHTCIF